VVELMRRQREKRRFRPKAGFWRRVEFERIEKLTARMQAVGDCFAVEAPNSAVLRVALDPGGTGPTGSPAALRSGTNMAASKRMRRATLVAA